MPAPQNQHGPIDSDGNPIPVSEPFGRSHRRFDLGLGYRQAAAMGRM